MAQIPKKKPPPKRVPRPAPRGAPEDSDTKERDSSPEIQVGFAPAGRETLAAITLDARPGGPGPELEFHLVPAGRETLAAITAELTPPSARISSTDDSPDPAEAKTGVRPRLRTRGYSEPPAETPPPVPAPRMTMPGVAPPANAPATKADRVSKDTIDALASAMLEPVPPPSSARRTQASLDVYELVTFVVKGDDIGQLSTESTRREFVVERLMHRLPISTVDQIDRVDVTPWTVRGTLILRVWCKVRAPLR